MSEDTIKGVKNIRRYVNHFCYLKDEFGAKKNISVKLKRLEHLPHAYAWATVSKRASTIGVTSNHIERYILWHELGHIHDTNRPKRYPRYLAEANAQLWALKTLHKLGYSKLYSDIMHYTNVWLDEQYLRKYKIPNYYKVAAKYILKQLEKEGLPLV